MEKVTKDEYLTHCYTRMDELTKEMDMLTPDNKEYYECYDELSKIFEQVNKIEEADLKRQQYEDSRQDTKEELKIKQAQADAEMKRAEAETKKGKWTLVGTIVTGVLGFAGAALATAEGVWGTKRITKYEETGAVTSKAYNGTIHKPKWRN